jgi:hypothetical protein
MLWDLPTLLLPNLLHELDQICHLSLIMLPLGLQSLYPLTLGLSLGPLSQLGLLLGSKLLQIGLQYLTPMFQ